MEKLFGWMFLLVALVWLLPLVGVVVGSQAVHTWIAVIAFAVIGIKSLMK